MTRDEKGELAMTRDDWDDLGLVGMTRDNWDNWDD